MQFWGKLDASSLQWKPQASAGSLTHHTLHWHPPTLHDSHCDFYQAKGWERRKKKRPQGENMETKRRRRSAPLTSMCESECGQILTESSRFLGGENTLENWNRSWLAGGSTSMFVYGTVAPPDKASFGNKSFQVVQRSAEEQNLYLSPLSFYFTTGSFFPFSLFF